MKKIKSLIIIILIIICVANVSSAHGGNITGWKDKNSKDITEHNGKYYGYHKQNGEKHYHQVKWDEEDKRWIIIAPAVYYDEDFKKIENNNTAKSEKIQVELVSVVDGDTAKFKMQGKEITVRFLGINTRETVDPKRGEEAYGKEASDFTKSKLENATKIELEFDNSADEKDKYERYLAWVWIDNILLQNILVENGLAETYMLQNDYKYAGILQESEESAKNSKTGIWSEEIINVQNNENENQILTKSQTDTENNELLYVIMGVTIMLIISILNIAYNNKKKK